MTSNPTLPAPPGGSATRRSMDFGGLVIEYDDRVLEPRSWTTAQARWMADLLHRLPDGPVLELCSGAGHIGLLTAAYTGRDVVMVDASAAACELAARNVAANPLSGTVEIRHAHLEDALGAAERFVGVVADPPWVPSARTGAFPEDPLSAIDGGTDGLDVARLCIDVIDRHLASAGAAVLQLGTTAQAAALTPDLSADRLGAPGLRRVETRSYGDRGVLAQLVRP